MNLETVDLLFDLGYQAGLTDKPCVWGHLGDQDAAVLEAGFRCGQIAAAGRRDLLRRLAAAIEAGTIDQFAAEIGLREALR